MHTNDAIRVTGKCLLAIDTGIFHCISCQGLYLWDAIGKQCKLTGVLLPILRNFCFSYVQSDLRKQRSGNRCNLLAPAA